MDKQETPERDIRQLRRLENLTDAVFALVIVLIVYDLETPSRVDFSGGTLTDFLTANGVAFSLSLIGLVLVVIYWLQNNALFGCLKRTDNRHTAAFLIQIFLLLFYLYAIGLGISFKGDSSLLAAQSITAALVGFAAGFGWWYAGKNRRLLTDDTTDQQVRNLLLSTLAEPVTALITLPCALLGSLVWSAAWLAYPLVVWFLRRFRLPE
jgi:uncharacterized membrane protein